MGCMVEPNVAIALFMTMGTALVALAGGRVYISWRSRGHRGVVKVDGRPGEREER